MIMMAKTISCSVNSYQSVQQTTENVEISECNVFCVLHSPAKTSEKNIIKFNLSNGVILKDWANEGKTNKTRTIK